MRQFFKEYDPETLVFLKHRLSQNLILIKAQIKVRHGHASQVFRVQQMTHEYNRLMCQFKCLDQLPNQEFQPIKLITKGACACCQSQMTTPLESLIQKNLKTSVSGNR